MLAALTVLMGLWLVFIPGEGIYVLRGQHNFYYSQFSRNSRLWAGEEYAPRAYPTEAVSFILSARPPGRMFNRNYFAGYLVWALSPEHYKVFTDSRFDIFGQDFLFDEQSVAGGLTEEMVRDYYANMPDPQPGHRPWKEVVEEYNINWLMLEKDELNNFRLLEPDSGWALIYMDHTYRIWIKRAPENQPWIEKYEVTDPRLIDAMRQQEFE